MLTTNTTTVRDTGMAALSYLKARVLDGKSAQRFADTTQSDKAFAQKRAELLRPPYVPGDAKNKDYTEKLHKVVQDLSKLSNEPLAVGGGSQVVATATAVTKAKPIGNGNGKGSDPRNFAELVQRISQVTPFTVSKVQVGDDLYNNVELFLADGRIYASEPNMDVKYAVGNYNDFDGKILTTDGQNVPITITKW